MNLISQSENKDVRAAEWTLAITVTISLIAPRASWLMLTACAFLAFAQFIMTNRSALFRIDLAPPRSVLATLFVFVLYVVLSTFWSLDPYLTAKKTLAIAWLYVCVFIVFLRLSLFDQTARFFLARGILFGFLVGLIVFATEIISSGALVFFLIKSFGGTLGLVRGGTTYVDGVATAIDVVALNRHAIGIPILLWPSLYFLLHAQCTQSIGKWLAPVILSLVGVSLVLSNNESAKVAIICASLVFVVAKVVPRFAIVLVLAGWICASLFVLPAVEIAHRINLDGHAWIQPSGKERLKIWKAMYDNYWSNPIVGIGVRSTQARNNGVTKSSPTPLVLPRGLKLWHYVPHHAHNAFLQVWYELGVVGALIFASIGAAFVGQISRLNNRILCYAVAQFVSIAVILGLSYGLWQTWYQATLLLSILAFYVMKGFKNTDPRQIE